MRLQRSRQELTEISVRTRRCRRHYKDVSRTANLERDMDHDVVAGGHGHSDCGNGYRRSWEDSPRDRVEQRGPFLGLVQRPPTVFCPPPYQLRRALVVALP